MESYLSGNSFSGLQCRLTYQLNVFYTETYNHQALNGTHNSLLEAEVRYLREEPEEWKRGQQFLAGDLMPYSTTQSRTLARYREES